jgi:hypothetical protein
MKKHENRLAFSLIELSVVILVIGILVIGITKGSRIIRESKLQTAAALTRSSPIVATSGLVAWFDASDSSTLNKNAVASVTVNNYGNIADSDLISVWLDKNPQSVSKIQTTAPSDPRRPIYVENGIGGLPSLSFSGTDTSGSYLASSTAPIGESDKTYTLFAVWQSDVANKRGYIVSQNPTATTTSRHASIYVVSDGTYGFIGQSNDYSAAAYQEKKSYVSAIRVNNELASNNIAIYTNGVVNTGSSASPSTLNIGANNFSIGGISSATIRYFDGLISEVIVFNRNLKDSEIRAINSYLSQKYNIPLI